MVTALLLAATFYKDVLPVLQDHCQQCHRPGQIAPMPLITYAQARTNAKAMARVVDSRKMPPSLADPKHGHCAKSRSLSSKETETLIGWAAAGAPPDDPHDAPPPKQWVE